MILDATGRGHYVGCNLNIDVLERQQFDWYGEGDDMIWIDGELRLRGTGTEDYFNTAWSPTREFHTPYHGLTVYSGTADWPWSGKNSMYRYHIEDPIYFRESSQAHRRSIRDDKCPTCLSPCQMNVSAVKQVVPYVKFLVRAAREKHRRPEEVSQTSPKAVHPL